ncbi:MAG: isopenicillin N synthase family dioxygenase [Thiolinea sp.]
MNIPLINLQKLNHDLSSGTETELQRLDHACREIGFLALSHHDVDPALMVKMREVLQQWFARSEANKRQLIVEQQNYRGFIPLGMFTPNQDAGQGDLYEGYKLHFEVAASDTICEVCDLYGPNRWPEDMPVFSDTVQQYWRTMDGIAEVLLRSFAVTLGLSAAEMLEKFALPLTNMTLLHYPPTYEAGRVGIHPHKDSDIFTLLYPDAVGGLEVRTTQGNWIEADGPDHALIVNVGNMLETWSGGRYLSTPHRVINRTGRERYSFPYFVVPRHDVMIEPLVEPLPGFSWRTISSGELSAEVWRTNWPDQLPVDPELNLGSLN